ncbi:E3 ubiquitin-protein ligase TRIM21 [Nibea albiflora]|uniref:E3 ubiquitin-protein ligase TRIM21 n=1 Tax=Nibea albiflora TaxID=240163 RepID=A0ACB7FKG4_NIBAL|nr:E3 ubiquitin-protein ligase TRIM21 [Nibea albiflora]
MAPISGLLFLCSICLYAFAQDAQDFTSLIEFAERTLNELIETIDVKQRTTQKYTVDIDELEQEISELMKRMTEVKHPSSFEDHNDWADFHVDPSSHEETVLGTLIQLEEEVTKMIKKLLAEAELKTAQHYEVDVTLDPDTANPWLILSDDEKQVKESDVKKNLPDNPERFSKFLFVLGKQSFSSGRFYYEVQVKGKTVWFLGVATESINRKEIILPRPQSGYWAIWLNGRNQYKTVDSPSVVLSLKSKPEKVGVFVDYEEGLVSFYDVDAAALIYSFTGCSFTEKLYPYFSPGINDHGKNSAHADHLSCHSH